MQCSVLVIGFIICFLAGQAQQKPVNKPATAANSAVDIYMAVDIYNKSTGNITVGTWQNGVITTSPGENNNTGVVSLCVEGDNIYMAGYYDNQAAWWKNGQLFQLTNKPNIGDAVSVMAAGGHIYIAGKERIIEKWYYGWTHAIDIPTVWKDGVPTPLTNLTLKTLGTNQNHLARAISMAIDNNGDVYIVGTVPGPDEAIQYWKNGEKVKELVDIPVTPVNMYIVNGDFYVVGVLGYRGQAAYWKWSKGKTELKVLTTGGDSKADALAVSGEDVYVAGHEGGVGKYWKNGTPVTLASGAVDFMGLYGLAVWGSDVYVTGPDTDGKTKCWKNGKEFIVLPGMSVGGIVVKKAKGKGYIPGTTGVQSATPSSSSSPAPSSAASAADSRPKETTATAGSGAKYTTLIAGKWFATREVYVMKDGREEERTETPDGYLFERNGDGMELEHAVPFSWTISGNKINCSFKADGQKWSLEIVKLDRKTLIVKNYYDKDDDRDYCLYTFEKEEN